jgi:hypothetical protein
VSAGFPSFMAATSEADYDRRCYGVRADAETPASRRRGETREDGS